MTNPSIRLESRPPQFEDGALVELLSRRALYPNNPLKYTGIIQYHYEMRHDSGEREWFYHVLNPLIPDELDKTVSERDLRLHKVKP